MAINILGWDGWEVTKGEVKGPDYRFEAEYKVRPERCPQCFSETVHSKGIATLKDIRDTRMHGKRVGIRVRKRRWECQKCEHAWTDAPPEIDGSKQMTTRLLEALRDESFRRRFTELAHSYGVAEGTVRNVFNEEMENRQAKWRIDAPKVLGVDEVHVGGRRFVAANLGSKPVALVEMLEDRNQATVERFLETTEWVRSAEIVAMDMWNPYRQAVQKTLPGATIVVDKFHLLQLANRIVDRERDDLARYGSNRVLARLKGSREILRKRLHDLTKGERDRLERWGKWFPSLVATYELKEALHSVYEASDREEAEERMEWWTAQVPKRLEVAFEGALQALDSWRKEILAYFDTGVTNAGTETLNRFIRLTYELGNGYSFPVLRGKMLYATEPVTTKFWTTKAKASGIPGAMTFSMFDDRGGERRTAGANLERLIADMERRSGEWSDPDLWME